MRSRIGKFLRTWADRVDDAGAPHATGWRFTFETGEGVRFREDGKGCRLWYYGNTDYEKAHTEADSAAEDAWKAEQARLLMVAMTEDDPVVAGAAAAEHRRRMFEGLTRA